MALIGEGGGIPSSALSAVPKVAPPDGYKSRYGVLVRDSDGAEVILHLENVERFTLPNSVTSAVLNEAGVFEIYPNPTQLHIEGRLSMVPHGKNDPIVYTPSDMHRRPLSKLAQLIDFSNNIHTTFTFISGYFGDLTSGKWPVPFVIKEFTFEPGQSRNLIDYSLDLMEVTNTGLRSDNSAQHSAAENIGDQSLTPLGSAVNMLQSLNPFGSPRT